MSTPKIFLTGASGYVGGDVLHALLTTHPEWANSITLLLRTRSHESTIRSKYPNLNLNLFFASYDTPADLAALEAEVARHDLVLHFAVSADCLPAAQAIVRGLEKRVDVGGVGIYIHTSGTDVLLDPEAKPEPIPVGQQVRVYDDWKGIDELRRLPDAAPHREVDKFVLAAGTDTLKTAIVCPSTVYGVGRGPVSQRSDQIYKLARLILQNRQGYQFADGRTFWNAVHVYDLSRLYVSLVEDAIGLITTPTTEGQGNAQGGKATWNADGYYLVEAGIYHWGEVAKHITAEAYALGLVPSTGVTSVGIQEREILAPAGRPVTNYAVRAEAVRAKELLGWRAVEGTLVEEIPAIVRSEARALGLL
ncbi:hypothetical protein BJX64DRAFT_300420 [Aspergillus heterothallicus]